MKFEKKFLSQEQQHAAETNTQSQQAIHEFATPEEMLRFDGKQTRVPDRVGERLSRSLQHQPRLTKPWWKRLFS
jgi:hypothetical protein